MIDPKQLLEYIVRPTLDAMGMGGRAAEELLMGTAAQESHLRYIHQKGFGPALGLWQMEPRTHDDIWKNFSGTTRRAIEDLGYGVAFVGSGNLLFDLKYACAMTRLHYRRIRQPLPLAGDTVGQAGYWKMYYNTFLGSGKVSDYIKNFELVRHAWGERGE